MELEEKLSHVLELLDKLDIEVRFESLDGNGGGACKLRHKLMVVIDLDSEPDERYSTALSALKLVTDLDDVYVLPEVRNDLDKSSP